MKRKERTLLVLALRALDALLLMLDQATGGNRVEVRSLDPENYELAMMIRARLMAATGEESVWAESVKKPGKE